MFFFGKGRMDEFHKVSNSIHPSSEYFRTEYVGMLTTYVLKLRAWLQWLIICPVQPKAKVNICTSAALLNIPHRSIARRRTTWYMEVSGLKLLPPNKFLRSPCC